MKPIFFAWTRSFWLTAIGVAVLIFGAPVEVLNGIGAAIAIFTPYDTVTITEALNTIAPAVLWLAAIQQRSGAARPYTLDPRAID